MIRASSLLSLVLAGPHHHFGARGRHPRAWGAPLVASHPAEGSRSRLLLDWRGPERGTRAGVPLARRSGRRRSACCLLLAVLSAGCRQDMHDQPKLQALEYSDFFSNGAGARPLVAGTVARGMLNEDEHLYTGKVNGQPATTFPFEMTAAALSRGRERYDIYCAPCHSRTGYGDGMVVRRGFRRPPSLHSDELRMAPPGFFFDVITNGFGGMPDYRVEVSVRDRWAIAAYIRALQLSQRVDVAELPQEDRDALEKVR